MNPGDRVMTANWHGRLTLSTLVEIGPQYAVLRRDSGTLSLCSVSAVHQARCVFCQHEILPDDEATGNPAAEPFGLMDYQYEPAHTNCCHRAAIDAANARHAAQ